MLFSWQRFMIAKNNNHHRQRHLLFSSLDFLSLILWSTSTRQASSLIPRNFLSSVRHPLIPATASFLQRQTSQHHYSSVVRSASHRSHSTTTATTSETKDITKNNSNKSNNVSSDITTNNHNININSMNFHTWHDGKHVAVPHCMVPLTFDSHKGSSGRVGVLGGSAQYTGAPYYAAMASLKAGADLAYVFCAQEACLPIKSYSPELMVAPVYSAAAFDACVLAQHNSNGDDTDSGNAAKKEQLIHQMVQEVTSKMDRLHALVIGPGLGRCPLVCEATSRIIQHAKSQQLALILDADALWMLAQPQYRNLLNHYQDAPVVLTPNVVEYKRLFSTDNNNNNDTSSSLQFATIVRKGHFDAIVKNGQELLSCQEVGGKKRSGGIGDVLAGTLGTLVAWNVILNDKDNKTKPTQEKLSHDNLLALSCWTACCFVKHATKLAFDDKKRSMTAPDVLEHLGPAIDQMTNEFDALDDAPSSSNR